MIVSAATSKTEIKQISNVSILGLLFLLMLPPYSIQPSMCSSGGSSLTWLRMKRIRPTILI